MATMPVSLRSTRVGLLPALIVLLAATPSFHGAEFQVNLTTTGPQARPDVAADAAGNFIVVWESARDGSYYSLDILGQRFDPAGNPLGGEFLVNTTDIGTEYLGSFTRPAVDLNDAGKFVVAWQSFYYSFAYSYYAWDVHVRRFNSAGDPVADDSPVGPVAQIPNRQEPAVGVNRGGDFLVVWMKGSGLAVAQHFDPNGVALSGETILAPVNAPFGEHAVATRGDLGPVVSWSSFGDGSSSAILGLEFDELTLPMGSEFQINTFTPGYQGEPSVAATEDGRFVTVWNSQDQDGSLSGIFGQLFDSTGQRLRGEFQVNSYTTGRQSFPDVAMDVRGDFMVVWQSESQDGSGQGIFGQRFDVAGNRIGPEFPVNTATAGSQLGPAVASTGPGAFVAVWQGGDGNYSGIRGDLLPGCPALPGPVSELAVTLSPTESDLVFTWADLPDAENFILFASGDPSEIFGPRESVVRNLGASCGNAVCEPFHGEDCFTCADDCLGVLNGGPASRFCCGDGLSGPENPVGCGDPRCSDATHGCQSEIALILPAPAGDRFYLMAGSNACGTGTIR